MLYTYTFSFLIILVLFLRPTKITKIGIVKNLITGRVSVLFIHYLCVMPLNKGMLHGLLVKFDSVSKVLVAHFVKYLIFR